MHLDLVAIVVSEYDPAIDFFVGVLGFELVEDSPALTTSGGRHVLTLFERLHEHELPFYLNLMSHLAARGVPCPAPLPDRAGSLLVTFCGGVFGMVVS